MKLIKWQQAPFYPLYWISTSTSYSCYAMTFVIYSAINATIIAQAAGIITLTTSMPTTCS